MHFRVFIIACVAFLATAAPPELTTDDIVTDNCGYPNGNCYDNNCHGELSSDRITCTSGPYLGCPCGYGCGRNVGRCNENGCNGSNGRCTNNYLGCNCR
ncbi:uncharacterized protein BO80DRAFT_471135 [Aspergillus ibericus CBS 121593]|uniref:EGF-like domain-containing protein n=1 Tax=Aspergillus ibericus CBS 121593 TaxID=1448316 RepID=A0A395H6S3_9EURO|nr:hypothetical protein BO80DRAFT_471135 [Aspergillus ibericus CBS 121593]RAL03316.1 hypothetical protein BO80DRAFT_471135 [Aspergillus ibericus CBS 121593]